MNRVCNCCNSFSLHFHAILYVYGTSSVIKLNEGLKEFMMMMFLCNCYLQKKDKVSSEKFVIETNILNRGLRCFLLAFETVFWKPDQVFIFSQFSTCTGSIEIKTQVCEWTRKES